MLWYEVENREAELDVRCCCREKLRSLWTAEGGLKYEDAQFDAQTSVFASSKQSLSNLDRLIDAFRLGLAESPSLCACYRKTRPEAKAMMTKKDGFYIVSLLYGWEINHPSFSRAHTKKRWMWHNINIGALPFRKVSFVLAGGSHNECYYVSFSLTHVKRTNIRAVKERRTKHYFELILFARNPVIYIHHSSQGACVTTSDNYIAAYCERWCHGANTHTYMYLQSAIITLSKR